MGVDSIILSHPNKKISGTVKLTGSKSESNRALIIQALGKGKITVKNLSEAADTVTMGNALHQASQRKENPTIIDIGPAGTAMRFLTSYLNLVKGHFLLTGTERMQQRPINPLVNALRTIGANIEYVKNEGFPPIRIQGGLTQQNNKVTIPGDISSQYISSLLLVAASLENGLTIEIEGELTSRPYVTMTLDMLQEAGIRHEWVGNTIHIAPQDAQQATIYVEPDWSAASYWYAMVALSHNGSIHLPGLKQKSLQGDIAIAEIMRHFGVRTTFEQDDIFLQQDQAPTDKDFFDLKECPDLAQTIVVVAAALRKDVSFTGLETLKIKETDRIAALQNEIGKFGCQLIEDNQIYHLKTQGFSAPDALRIATYEDHRMAMAFAPLGLVFPKVIIEEPQVVEKSYPDFWTHLKEQGFIVSE